jgi:hypothetical protein
VIDQTHGTDASASLVTGPAPNAGSMSATVQPVPLEGREPWRRRGTFAGLVDRALDRLDVLGDSVAEAIGLR